jgi:hypothetical protein
MVHDSARRERERYLLEILDTTARVIERTTKRLEHDTKEDLETLRLILHELQGIRRELEPPQPPPPPPSTISRFSAVQFTGESMNNALALTVGQTSTASPITYLADGVTPSGATYSAATYTFSDPSATVALNSDGVTALVTGVAASAGPVSGSVTFTATDTDGAVSTWTNGFTITTSAVVPPPPPSQLSQSSALTFSTPA